MKVAITGGIGSGKSYVCQLLREQGIEVYDCDDAAKRLMATDDNVKRKLTEVVGEDTYVDGVLNKAAVAKFLLTSEQNKKLINSIVHPAVASDFIASGMTWLESAILFDCGFQKYVDRVVCVTAPLETRIRRVMRRDGIDRKRTKEWIAKQMPQEKVRQLADFEIINDGRHSLKKQIKVILKALNQLN
ncbi:MAG: dephospho-CoA kinase [Prevotella sp.]|nr:dephospho-CoA kinase [Prevotella sp.]